MTETEINFLSMLGDHPKTDILPHQGLLAQAAHGRLHLAPSEHQLLERRSGRMVAAAVAWEAAERSLAESRVTRLPFARTRPKRYARVDDAIERCRR